MRYYVYLLQSQADGSFYVGYTTSLRRRLEEHNSGQTSYTARKRPWILAYYEDFETKRDALVREIQLKRIRNRATYRELISSLLK